MINFARMVQSAILRRIAFVFVAGVFAYLASIGNARAQTTGPDGCLNLGAGCNREQAYASAVAKADLDGDSACKMIGVPTSVYTRADPRIGQPQQPGAGEYIVGYVCDNLTNTANLGFKYWYGGECSSVRLWDNATNKCKLICPEGFTEDPMRPGYCLDADACLARNEGEIPIMKTSGIAAPCIGGCQYRIAGPTVRVDGISTGVFTYSGLSCASPVPPAVADPAPLDGENCTVYGSVTQCVKPNGQECISGPSGKEFCWGPGETGNKTDTNFLQTRNAGDTPILPVMTLPNGDTLQQSGTSKSTVTNVTNNNNTTTTNTTTTNYTTVNGTNAGTTNQAKPVGGSGTDPAADSKNSGTGGGGCLPSNRPIVAGDPLLSMIAIQAWETRCALEKNNPTNETGDISNCKAAWTVTGTDQQINKARALREALCPGMPADADFLGTGEGEPATGEVKQTGEGLLPGGLDRSGFGFGTSCPVIPTVSVMGQTIDFNTVVFCDWMHLGGWFVVLFAGMTCLRLLTEA